MEIESQGWFSTVLVRLLIYSRAPETNNADQLKYFPYHGVALVPTIFVQEIHEMRNKRFVSWREINLNVE